MQTEHERVLEEFNRIVDGFEDWGYAPTLATRKGGNAVASDLRPGHRVRIRAQGCPPGMATILAVAHDAGCPLGNLAHPAQVVAILNGPDELPRILKTAPSTPVEFEN
jgi:hypothetical protein